jgi:hypothetical protein
MLKTAAESYTRRMYSEFEAEFKDQMLFSATVLKVEGSILTYMVTHMQSANVHIVIFNAENMTITCSCRKYESIGMYTFFIMIYSLYYKLRSTDIHMYQVYYASMPSKSSI